MLRSARRMKDEFLHPPVGDLAYVQLVRISAIDLVHRAELFEQFARSPEFAKDLSVQLHFVNLAVIHVSGAVGIGAIEVLMGSRRDADGPRGADIGVLRLEVSVVIEDLQPPVPAISD